MKHIEEKLAEGITVYCGDCRDVLGTLPVRSVRLVLTDPPYGNGTANGDSLERIRAGTFKGVSRRRPDGHGIAAIENDTREAMRLVVDEALHLTRRLLCAKSNCVCCFVGGFGDTFVWLGQRMIVHGLSVYSSVVWSKSNIGIGWRYRPEHELVLLAHSTGASLAWREGEPQIGSVFEGQAPQSSKRFHPNEKPLWLINGFVMRHTEPGDLVLDPFMGSGTTGVSCIKTGRRFVGMELDRKHFDVACRRIAHEIKNPGLFVEAPRPLVASMKYKPLFEEA